jgi:hypothetical protein
MTEKHVFVVANLKLIFGYKIGTNCNMVPNLKTRFQSLCHFISKCANLVANIRLNSSFKNEATKHAFVTKKEIKSVSFRTELMESRQHIHTNIRAYNSECDTNAGMPSCV